MLRTDLKSLHDTNVGFLTYLFDAPHYLEHYLKRYRRKCMKKEGWWSTGFNFNFFGIRQHSKIPSVHISLQREIIIKVLQSPLCMATPFARSKGRWQCREARTFCPALSRASLSGYVSDAWYPGSLGGVSQLAHSLVWNGSCCVCDLHTDSAEIWPSGWRKTRIPGEREHWPRFSYPLSSILYLQAYWPSSFFLTNSETRNSSISLEI